MHDTEPRRPEPGPKRPALIILHQPQSNPGHIGQWFTRNGHALDIRRPRYGDPLPSTLAGHCAAVIFGGPMSANDGDDFIKAETDWISVPLKEQRPFLGVCLGAQMMARLLGARVARDPEARVEIGYYPVQPTEAGAALGLWPQQFYQWHNEGFERPRGSTLLATADGPFANQAIAVGPAAVGVQFHPEITRAQVHRWSGYNLDKLAQPNAQAQSVHVDGHIAHAPSVQRWLDGLLAGMLARDRTG